MFKKPIEELDSLIRDHGFSKIILRLGGLATKEEEILKNESDTTLKLAFLITVSVLCEVRKNYGKIKGNKQQIDRLLTTPFIQEAMVTSNFFDERQCEAVKNAARYVESLS